MITTHPIAAQANADGDAIAVVEGNRRVSYRAWFTQIRAVADDLDAHLPRDPIPMVVPAHNTYEALTVLWAVLLLRRPIALLNPRLPLPAADRALAQLGAYVAWEPTSSLTPTASGGETDIAWDAPATLIWTSGSTGLPKIAVHTWRQLTTSATALNRHLQLTPADTWLWSLPLYHVSGLGIVVRTALAGATLCLPSPQMRLEDQLRQHSPSVISAVAAQLDTLLSNAPDSLSDCRIILGGGGAFSPALRHRAAGYPLVMSYGLTETASAVTATAPGETGSCGKPLSHARIHIDAKDRIAVKADSLLLGYWDNGVMSRSLTADGWFQTGDIGKWDPQGNLLVTGRQDAMLISGGENIHPEEIESEIRALPGVRDVVVVGVPHHRYGMRPVGFVRTNGCIDEKGIRIELEKRLPKFKIPDAFFPLPELPPDQLKHKRNALSEDAIQRLRQQVRINSDKHHTES